MKEWDIDSSISGAESCPVKDPTVASLGFAGHPGSAQPLDHAPVLHKQSHTICKEDMDMVL